jgi:hypothetical protein
VLRPSARPATESRAARAQVLALVLAAALAGPVRAQTATLEAHFPFVDCRSVDSAPADPARGLPPLAFVGSGGGVVVLDLGDESDPVPFRPAGFANPEGVYLRTGGAVRRVRA